MIKTNKQTKALQKQLAGEMVYSDSKFPLELWHSPFERLYNNGILRQVGHIASTIKKQKQRESRKEGWTMKTTGPASSHSLLPVSCFLLNLPRQRHLLRSKHSLLRSKRLTLSLEGDSHSIPAVLCLLFRDAVCGDVIIVTSFHSSLLALSERSVHTWVN